MTTNQVAVVVPAGIALPAHLQSADIAAQIAAANAEAAGGIKSGGFPSISIKSNHFHIKEGGELQTLMAAAQPGQPAIPMMCLEVVVLAANPALTRAYFPGEWEEGSVEEPTCRSSNGTAPDSDVAAKQSPVCASCPQNAWGSKISKFSGKEIKACGESKQLAILPAADLGFKALGLQVKAGSLKNWGQYVAALSGRNFPLFALVTNVTFDATQNGVLNFTFNRFLTLEELATVKERQQGSDVKLIVAQSRVLSAVPALSAPAAAPALPAPVQPAAPAAVATAPVVAPAPTPPVVPAAAAPVTGFGATSAAVQVPAGSAVAPASPNVTAEPPKRVRRTREQIAAANAAANPGATPPAGPDLSHLPPAILAAVQAVGVNSVAGQALLAQFPAQPAAPVVAAAPAVTTSAPVNVPVAAAPVSGFGAQPAPVSQPASAAVVSSAASLAEKLKARLAQGATPAVAG